MNFLESIALTSVERVHSAIIAWIFSEDNTALRSCDKSAIINKLFGINPSREYKSIKAVTEFDHRDIWIEADDCHFCIENKIKSYLTKNQLNTYAKSLTATDKKGVLSLVKMYNDPDEWLYFTYDDLLNALNSVHILDNNHGVILKEYIETLKHLTDCKKDFLNDHSKYPYVFEYASLTKKDKKQHPHGENYICKNQLETILQQALFWEICKEIDRDWIISETHGKANMSSILYSCKQDHINIDFAFQNGTFKIACCTHNYANSSKTNSKIAPWIEVFEKYKSANPKWRLNRPKHRARISISYQFRSDYYKMSKEQLTKEIKNQLMEAEQIKCQLIKVRESLK